MFLFINQSTEAFMKVRWWFNFAAGLALLVPVLVSAQQAARTEPDCPKKVKVLVQKIETGLFREYRSYSVVFQPRVLTARTAISGTVTDIKVSDGDLVSEGFVLIMLNEGLEAEAREAEAELERWKKILWNREHWKERSPAAEAQAKTRIEETQARLEEIKARSPQASVSASQTGTVELLVVPGTEVEAGTEVAKVTNPRLKTADLEVDPADLDLFPLGSEIDLGNGMTAVVAGVENNVVRLTVIDPAERLGAEPLSFKLLKREVIDAVVISEDQVLSDDAGDHVFVVNDNQARRADIVVDAQYESQALVTSGLEPKDLLITHHLLSRKTGQLADTLVCLQDGKRVRVMVQDPKSGRFVKFKGELPPSPAIEEEMQEPEKPEVAAEPETVEPAAEEVLREPAVEKEWSPSLGIGAGIGLSMMSDEVFKEVYGSSAVSFDFRLIYAFHPHVEGFIDVAYSTKTGTILGVDAETKIVRAPIALGARYVFEAGGKFKPYVGATAIAFNAKETNDYNPDAGYVTRWGFGLVGGVYYPVAPQVDLFFDMRYGFGTHQIADFEDEAKLDTLRLHLGFVYRFRL